METVKINEQFQCVALGAGDLEAFREALSHSYSNDNSAMSDFVRARGKERLENPNDPFIRNWLLNPDYKIFVLYENATANTRKFVGTAALRYMPEIGSGELCNAYIAPEYRGQKLIDIFYEARENDLMLKGKFTTAQTRISADNTASQNAALRNGFTPTSQEVDGQIIFEKTL